MGVNFTPDYLQKNVKKRNITVYICNRKTRFNDFWDSARVHSLNNLQKSRMRICRHIRGVFFF